MPELMDRVWTNGPHYVDNDGNSYGTSSVDRKPWPKVFRVPGSGDKRLDATRITPSHYRNPHVVEF